ncbi:PAS domain-containing sensor histidine kinase [Ancylomarina longa]|uniref:histidine kinase n=1 Tax=Ancylomarina longa TaxID=2487017 RepID=A0A434AWH3_9BACT|nr:PAS domain-containing sensor histidine kinase [Ancylomarina longa]RUT78823.1 PAS domain-containing sensor histidine kinase [Ancylomarina longa]
MLKESTYQLKDRIEELEGELLELRNELAQNNHEFESLDVINQINGKETAISVIDTDFTIIEMNYKCLRDSNLDNNCVLGKKCYAILYDLDQPCKECTVEQVIQNKIANKFLKSYSENGNVKFEEKSVSPIFDSNGTVDKLVIQSEDITNYYHLIDKVGQREEFYKTIFESAGDAFLIHDEAGKIIEFGSQLPILLQYSEEELNKLSIPDIDDPNNSMDYGDRKKQIDKKGSAIFETTLISKSQAIIPVEVVVNLIDTLGQRVYFVAIRNVSNRKIAENKLKESEERFRTLVENATDLIMRFDRNYKHLFVNSAIQKVLNMEPDNFIGKTHQELGFPDDLCKFWEQEMQIVFDSAKTRTVEFSLKIKDKTHYFEWQLIPEFNSQGQNDTLMAIARDITSRKLSEMALNEALITKDKFFSILAHDLKNPFNVLLPISQSLMEDARRIGVEQIEEAATLINSAVKQEFNLLNNLLEWSRSQMGNILFNPKPTDLSRLVNSNMLLHEINADKKQINISLQKKGDTNAYVDEYMVDTVIRNLLSNAIKFTKIGGEIEISLNNLEDRLVLSVKDNGIGISVENQNKLFRIDTNYTRIGTSDEIGTGLGLILCKEFVGQNKGDISVESELEKGSIFSVSLPKNP